MRSRLSASWWVPGIAPHERAAGVHTRPAWAAIVDGVVDEDTGDTDAPLDGLVTWACERVGQQVLPPDQVAVAAGGHPGARGRGDAVPPHAAAPARGGPGGRALTASVYRTGLLPQFVADAAGDH